LIPELDKEIQNLANELENGRGFLLLRGLPAELYSEEEMAIIYYGLGLHMGTPVTQNPRADLLGVVTAIGNSKEKTTRVYETNAYLPYHTDLSDVVGLLSIRKAKQGGLSSLVSAATVYNEILERNPHYLALLYRPLYFAHLGNDLPVPSPIFSYHEDKLSCRYLRAYIELGHEQSNVKLCQVEVQALDLIDAIIHDPAIRLDMMLEPGDMLYLPPHYAHDGIAIGECMTYSIGFRAPAFQELGEAFLQFMADSIDLPRPLRRSRPDAGEESGRIADADGGTHRRRIEQDAVHRR